MNHVDSKLTKSYVELFFHNLLANFNWITVTRPIIINILPIAKEYSNTGYEK